jgi:glucose-6-phosphate 1-dehydrogenase
MRIETPVTIVVFGGTGDLAEIKLLPALYDLEKADCMPEQFFVVGFSRKDLSHEDYQSFIARSLEQKGKTDANRFIERGRYKQGDLLNVASYEALAEYLHALDDSLGVCTNKLFYLAVPPTLYESVFRNLAASGLTVPCQAHATSDSWTRLLVEKPFGDDQEHAQHLDTLLGTLFKEEQIFRIDHYLAKETLQNILTFRFANAMFEPVWNGDAIERIDVELLESFDIKKRGSFYDKIGALKDVGQNHLLQMLALIAMEDPVHIDATSIRNARAKVLQSIKHIEPMETAVVRGQYVGYTNVEGVVPDSQTETFFSMKVRVDTPRWKDTLFYVRSGKAMNETCSRITVTFKERASCMCPAENEHPHKNTITFLIQPNEGITATFWAKRPGFTYELEEKELSFVYPHAEQRLPDAYERVLYDALRGDQTLFISTEEVKAQWNLIMPIVNTWQSLPLFLYEPGVHPHAIDGTI